MPFDSQGNIELPALAAKQRSRRLRASAQYCLMR